MKISTTNKKALKGHLHNVTTLKFWPDGALLLSGSVDCRMILWDPYTFEKKQTFSLLFPLQNYVFDMEVGDIKLFP